MKKLDHAEGSKTDSVAGAASDLLLACERADWMQVVLNGGPPCFHLEGAKFCLRARAWIGHDRPRFHAYVSLRELLSTALEKGEAQHGVKSTATDQQKGQLGE